MNESIIRFYRITNRLKQKIRTGWQEVEISSERLESVAEHVYGCLMLALAIDSEYHLSLDMLKVLKLISLHELEETIMKDYTLRDTISEEDRLALGRKCVHEATEGLIQQKEMEDLLEEFNRQKTKEAIFARHIDKIECDFQAKLYDLEGHFSLEKALEDLKYYGEREESIKSKVKTASDVWIEGDKPRYQEDEIFKTLIEDIQKLSTKEADTIG